MVDYEALVLVLVLVFVVVLVDGWYWLSFGCMLVGSLHRPGVVDPSVHGYEKQQTGELFSSLTPYCCLGCLHPKWIFRWNSRLEIVAMAFVECCRCCCSYYILIF